MASRKNYFQKKYIGKDYVAWGSDLILDKDLAWKRISRRARRSVLEAKKITGLVIKKKKGTKNDLDMFRKIWYDPKDSELGKNGFKKSQHVYFAYLNGELIAGIVVTEVGQNLFLHFNAGTERAKKLQVPSLMIWHIVEEFHKSHFKYLDIGCSFRQSLQEYFKNWATYEYPIIYHPPRLSPRIDLTPFDNYAYNLKPDNSVNVDLELEKKFKKKPFTYFPLGKDAIFALIKHLGLVQEDEVFITTTTGSSYISSGVTSSIEAVSSWNRKITNRTKAIFVIHEFGFVHPKLKELSALAKKMKIPLIEDCAYAWQSGKAGSFGDFLIYSFPKYFSVQYGGLLVGIHFEDQYIWDNFRRLDFEKRKIIREQLSNCIKKSDQIAKTLRENYFYLKQLFEEEGHRPFFAIKDDETPAFFILKVDSSKKMESISSRLDYFGIECGAFHHNNAVFLPIHQNLAKKHLDYVYGAVRGGLREDGWIIDPKKYFDLINKGGVRQRDQAEEARENLVSKIMPEL